MQVIQHQLSTRTSVNARQVACSSARSRLVCRGIRAVSGDLKAQEAAPPASPAVSGVEMYEQALDYARAEAYEDARQGIWGHC